MCAAYTEVWQEDMGSTLKSSVFWGSRRWRETNVLPSYHNALWKWSLGGTNPLLPAACSLPCTDAFAAPVCCSDCFSWCCSCHPALPLPLPPVIQAAEDTQTHSRHTGLPSAFCCASWGHGLAGHYKPDIRVMLLAL